MISSEIVHCLNVLGIVKIEQQDALFMLEFELSNAGIIVCIFDSLFFLYEPLYMSLHDVVVDY